MTTQEFEKGEKKEPEHPFKLGFKDDESTSWQERGRRYQEREDLSHDEEPWAWKVEELVSESSKEKK